MIARLTGRIVHIEPNRAIVDVHGVGYEIYAPNSALEEWGMDEAVVHVSTQVREDAITLFGFATAVDRQAFQVLMGVSGIGPKLALACLDALGLDRLARAVDSDDFTSLARIPGVGKKTAQRLALELKGKLPAGFEPRAPGTPPTAAPTSDTLVLALEKLGYTRAEIDRAQQQLAADGVGDTVPVGERLRKALAILYRGER